MAEIDVRRDRDREVWEQTGFRLSWGAIFAGLVVATVIQIALSLLGVGLGFLGWNPGDPLADLGTGAAIWTGLVAIISLFIGGLTTGRLAGVLTKGDGALHGVVMWGLSTLLAVYLISSGVGSLLGSAFGIVSQTAGAVASGVTQAGAAALGQAGGIDFGALQSEIETALEQTGNPALQPEAIQEDLEATGEAATTTGQSNEAVAQELTERIQQTAGNVDRQDLINVIAARTDLTPAEADALATRIETAANNARTQVASTVQNVQTQAVQTAGDLQGALVRGAWLALLTMGLSVGAAAAGASMTARD